MTHNTLDYAARIRQSGHRLTSQRKLILDAVCAGRGHTTLDEVYTRVQATAPTVNLATVYRTLDFLCDIRLVVRAHVGKQIYYEIAGPEPHHHLICRHCGHEEELSNQMVERFFADVQHRYHFAVDSEHLTLFGACPHCQQVQSSINQA
jgi:Fur family transcriptional regulator, ferric uptake regulator